MDARAAGGAAAGRRCHADRTSRTSHNARQAEYLKMQEKQNIPIHNTGKAEFHSVLYTTNCTMHNAGVQDK